MESSRAAPVVIAIAAVLLLVGGYVGSYYAMVQTGFIGFDQHGYVATATYRWGGEPIATFFYPIHQLDRRLRPDRWHPQIDVQPALRN